jgi:hypothetical protein
VVRASSSAIVERPVVDVFAYLIDLPRHVDWKGTVLFIDPLSPQPVAAGFQFLEVRQTLGRRFECVSEVDECEPPRRLAWHAVDGPVAYRLEYTLVQREDGSTRIESVVTADDGAGGFFGLGDPVLQAFLEREMANAFGNMKDILEGRDEGC